MIPSYQLKLEWAEKHLAALDHVIGRYLGRNPCRVVGDFEADDSHYVCRFWVDTEPPEDLPLLIGDFLANLRAVLDHLVNELSLPARASDFSWPFCRSDEIFYRANPPGSDKWREDSGMFRIRRIKPADQAHVRLLQPYITKEDPNATLALLNRLRNRDEHRSIRVVAVQPIKANFQFKQLVIGEPGLEPFDPPFEHKAKMAVFTITRDPNVKVPVEGYVAPTVVFRDPPARAMQVSLTLHRMLDTVRQILGWFR